MPNLTKLLRADDVAEILGVSRRTAMELMRQMPNINIGTSMRRPRLAVRREDLDRWIASRPSPPDGPAVKQQRRPRLHIRPNVRHPSTFFAISTDCLASRA